MSCGARLERPGADRVNGTHLDRCKCVGLSGHHKCSTPCLCVSSISMTSTNAFSPDTKLMQGQKRKLARRWWGGRRGRGRRTLIWFIGTVSVVTCGEEPLVKWQRAISRVGKAGRETETRSERKKAQNRQTMPGRKKAWVAMTVVGDR